MTTWADQFNTYQDACDFYGCDGPRELAAEERYRAMEEAVEMQDAMEARGGPLPPFVWDWEG
jgi:hypothetical protein